MSAPANKLRTAIVGAGKMGQIHAKVLSKLPQSSLVGIVDVQQDKAKKLAKEYKCTAFTDAKELLGKVDAVTISAPTTSHLALAEFFISNNIPILIEKPLAASAEQGGKIVALSKKHNTVVAVGHSERCNPVVQAMKRLQIEPKFIEATRISPYPFRSTDISVVLDVMIHDIDIILALAQSAVKKVDAVGVNVIGDYEDICNARITFENGCIANVTASRLALKTVRKIRLFSRQAYLSLDFLKKEGVVIKADPNSDAVKWIKQKQAEDNFDFSTVNWPDLLHIEQLDIDDREPLRVEQESFLNSILNSDSRPEVTAEEGLAALKCAEAILKSVKEHKWD
ncbi:MAG: Gfo/Idh/MocA family oxidoreductase [Planctomycetes bacterium]|nr:Gfo/Idh/MocA family oxidoreductase [Planctomycetota bacterium]MBU1518039.1 Gfo/Idh/MocA family oxidoreductase [Planctomycetota bacterium]MBU2458203.1 Gfo/Idh/MocA family oxidoreductase [Planctomycetota bacterium]MBU2596952.1 Gfo/Idh/MocA family oxidoreductase [Planctomycetota bacterium]